MAAPIHRTRKDFKNRTVSTIEIQRQIGPGLRAGGFGKRISIIGVDRTRAPKELTK